MKKILFSMIFLIACACLPAHAQQSGISIGNSPPSGNCAGGNVEYIDLLAGNFYVCKISGSTGVWTTISGSGSMTYPGAGVAVSTGSAWDTSLTAPAGALVGTSDSQSLTNKNMSGAGNTWPTFNQNTSGTAANLSGTPTLPNGTAGSTQSPGDNSTKLATTAYADAAASGGNGITNQAAKGIPYNADGTATHINAVVAAPTTKGQYSCGYTLPTDAAVIPSCPLVGIVANQGTGGAILFSDNNSIIRNPGATLSLATPATLENTNFATVITTPNGTATTITPTTWTISVNGATAGATGVCPAYASCRLYVDQVTSTQWDLDTTYLAGHGLWQACGSRGLGDGLNAMAAGTYLQFACVNDTGATVTITGIHCWTDNAGTSTLNAANNAATSFLTGAVTCNNTKASGGAGGTQSATVTLASGDAISFTFVADGTSKQTNWTVSGTY